MYRVSQAVQPWMSQPAGAVNVSRLLCERAPGATALRGRAVGEDDSPPPPPGRGEPARHAAPRPPRGLRYAPVAASPLCAPPVRRAVAGARLVCGRWGGG